MPLDDLIAERIKKLEALKAAGVDPYPASTHKTHTISDARNALGHTLAVAGRVRSLRPHGKISFIDLEDETGRIQLFFALQEVSEESYALTKLLDIGDFIQAEGEVFQTQVGEITVKVKSWQVLTKSIRPLPSEWYGLKDTEERLRKRYLDMILNPETRDLFKKKSLFWQTIRNYMVDQGFLEVEMPVLENIPGGADARPFITHHNAQDIDLYLRISLELPLKRMLVAGFEKVFEIGRIFRNEGIDDEHLQDYTQIEFYWAYADYNQLMDFVQEMYQKIIQTLFGGLKTTWNDTEIDWSGTWPRVEYTALLNEHWGVDIDQMSVEDLYQLAAKLNVQIEPNLGKGRLLDYIYKKTIRPKLIQPMFVLNHPVEVEPLAKRLPQDPSKVQRMQILVMGSELGKGFSELNDPLDQRQRFEEQMKLRAEGDDEAQMMDEDFVEALEYGMPPAAGFGISERLFSMLMDRPIRECVVFPTMKPSHIVSHTTEINLTDKDNPNK
jgi:lysyl-tRNA synthetase, class II